MRYHYQKPEHYTTYYGHVYICNHPIYNRCTLYTIGLDGLAVIQQRYEPASKTTFWSEVDPWLVDTLYLHPLFRAYFLKHSGRAMHGLYPTVTVRQIMWGMKMKPLPKERWETVFDRKHI